MESEGEGGNSEDDSQISSFVGKEGGGTANTHQKIMTIAELEAGHS